jgi:ABC-type spermidine/putrescine transport system permease subunit I
MAQPDQSTGSGVALDHRPLVTNIAAESTRRRARTAGSALSMRVLMAPMLIFLALMVALPLAYAVWLSMTDFRFGQEAGFTGLQNYRNMLADPDFWNGLQVAFALYLMSLALQLVFGCYLGMLLNRLRFARRFLQTVLMSPFLMPPVVIGMMWLVILDPSLGAANWLLSTVGLPPSNWLASPQLVVPVMAMLDTWQWTPFVALLVLGGLQTMPDGVAEAAAIDGARLRHAALHHPAVADADAVHRHGAAQRRPAALLRPDLHHHPGRPGHVVADLERVRLQAGPGILRHGLCQRADDYAGRRGVRRGAGIVAVPAGGGMVKFEC